MPSLVITANPSTEECVHTSLIVFWEKIGYSIEMELIFNDKKPIEASPLWFGSLMRNFKLDSRVNCQSQSVRCYMQTTDKQVHSTSSQTREHDKWLASLIILTTIHRKVWQFEWISDIIWSILEIWLHSFGCITPAKHGCATLNSMWTSYGCALVNMVALLWMRCTG